MCYPNECMKCYTHNSSAHGDKSICLFFISIFLYVAKDVMHVKHNFAVSGRANYSVTSMGVATSYTKLMSSGVNSPGCALISFTFH